MLEGPNIKSLMELLKNTRLDVVVAGGVSTIEDVKRLKALEPEGLRGMIIGKAFYENKIDLVAALVDMEGRPWCEWRHGKPITQNSLARLLAPFGLSPGNLRTHGQVNKGYRLEQFRDAFARYIPIPPNSTATPLQMADFCGFSGFFKPLHTSPCSGLISP